MNDITQLRVGYLSVFREGFIKIDKGRRGFVRGGFFVVVLVVLYPLGAEHNRRSFVDLHDQTQRQDRLMTGDMDMVLTRVGMEEKIF